MRSFVTVLALFSTTFLTVAPAAAQSIARPNSWTLTPFLHGSLAVGDPAPENSFGLGFAVGYDWTSNLGFEGELSHLFDVAGDSADLDWSVTTFSGNAIYHFDVRHVTPYATLGLGFEHSGHSLKDLTELPDLSATEITVNFGGGVKYPLNDRWTARGDLRRFVASDIAPDHWRLYGGLTYNLGR
jgi:opacity protein-like surface antigen